MSEGLERAARALARGDRGDEEDWPRYIDQVREVLEALRETPPSARMGLMIAGDEWRELIDALLNGGPGRG